jgi:hypothetical protein
MCRIYDPVSDATSRLNMSRLSAPDAPRVFRDLESHQLRLLETRVAVLADDEGVVHRDDSFLAINQISRSHKLSTLDRAWKASQRHAEGPPVRSNRVAGGPGTPQDTLAIALASR